MATFSLGTGAVPGAPGVYINERAGLGAPQVAAFSTVYMLVEAESSVPVQNFPFNSPVKITSLQDYKALIGGNIPQSGIPLLSYNCVNAFYQNAQVGDLRVVRVGTPNQVIEIEILPSGSKVNSTGIPSNLEAGDVVYAKLLINGIQLVAGDGTTGFDANGEWLGVPVTIPVDYVAGDAANNRKISAAIASAIATAIESNPSVSSSVYVRQSGLVADIQTGSNSENGFVTISAAAFNGPVNVVINSDTIGADYILLPNSFDVQNIVGSTTLQLTPQDYKQCINTAFEGQQDQGYLITPTAYAQFNAAGRSIVGAAAAALAESNGYKWMALADAGPFLVTDINEYSNFSPLEAAEDLNQGSSYLVSNAIYKWIGETVTRIRLPYQAIVGGSSAQQPVSESVFSVPSGEKVGLLDPATYVGNSGSEAEYGVFELDSDARWPSELQIQKVILSGADDPTNDLHAYEGTEVYVVAPPYEPDVTGSFPRNYVYLATTAAAASSILAQVTAAGGTKALVDATTTPTGAIAIATPTGSTFSLSYGTPFWSLSVEINGQTSNLIENISGATVAVNTTHLPGTLQNPTATYRLGFVSRTILNPANATGGISNSSGVVKFNVVSHGLRDGQVVYFTQPIVVNGTNLIEATTSSSATAYYVKVIDVNNFKLAATLTNYTSGVFLAWKTGTITASPTIFYTGVLAGQEGSANLGAVTALSLIRGRKYAFDSSSIFNAAPSSASAPGSSATDDPGVTIFFNNSRTVISDNQIAPYGEGFSSANWLPSLELVNPTLTPAAVTANAYCVPTVAQNFQSDAYLVPTIAPIDGGTYSATTSALTAANDYVLATGLTGTSTAAQVQAKLSKLVGVYFTVTGSGTAPDGSTAVAAGDRIAVVNNGGSISWIVIAPTIAGGDLSTASQVCHGSQVTLIYSPEETPPTSLWRFDAITPDEIISDALQGIGFGGVPQAVFVEAGVDNVNRLYDDSQRYFNPKGFIAYYGPWVKNSGGAYIPPSPYVAGVAVRRYRSEGYQFPPAGVKFQLTDAVEAQIPISSSQQNLLNPAGCNAVRTLPGYGNAVFIWGGRTRVNVKDAEQALYQFVNVRVILNIVYGSLRQAFDSQIFNIIDGFGVAFNQITTIGNSVLNQLYFQGALYGRRPSDAYQVICDNRINQPETLQQGIIFAKVFVTPAPTLERIQIDLIDVAVGQMQANLNAQGLGSNNASITA